MIEIFQLYLFLGMILHKVVWEVLKKKGPVNIGSDPNRPSLFKQLVKFTKVVFLLFLIVQTLLLPAVFPITTNPEILRWIGLILYTIGLVIALVGRFQLGKNWANIEDYQILQEQQLVDQGLYALIRHPIYTGDILLVLGLELALNSWLVLLVIPLAFVTYRQAKEEEQILADAFEGYAAYQEKTKLFLPYVL